MLLGMSMLADETRKDTLSGIRRRSLYPLKKKGLKRVKP
jgi:hypothetical protein